MELKNCRVAILVDMLYEDLELWYPKIRLEEEGATVHLVGMQRKTYQSKHGYPATAEMTVEEALPGTWDGIIIPGGYAPDHLRRHPEMVAFVRSHFQRGVLVATICHAPWLAISAGIVRGKRMTGFFAIKDDMVNAGAHYVDEPVVRDGNLISSRHPGDLGAFCRAIIGYLREK